jgi:hypothetical protein
MVGAGALHEGVDKPGEIEHLPPPVAQVAQLVEQGIENPRVGGSIPSLGTPKTVARHRREQVSFDEIWYKCRR